MKEALRDVLERNLRDLLDAAGDAGPLPEFTLEVPKNPDHGDFACNVALLLAKRLGEPPRAIAERLAAKLQDARELIDSTDVAGPGFVNVRLRGARWHDLLRCVLAANGRDPASRRERCRCRSGRKRAACGGSDPIERSR